MVGKIAGCIQLAPEQSSSGASGKDMVRVSRGEKKKKSYLHDVAFKST